MSSIKDVAREVEMSTATVSRALRGLPGVTDETRDRVLEAARRLGYVPSPSAAGLATGHTRTVAVVVPMVTQWFFAADDPGGRGGAARVRLRPAALQPRRRPGGAGHRIFETNLLTKRVDAVLILSLKPSPAEVVRLEQLDRPVTIVGADLPGWATVRINDELAAATATRHLIDLGHRRIGYVGGSTEGVLDFHGAGRTVGRLPGHDGRGRHAGRPVLGGQRRLHRRR